MGTASAIVFLSFALVIGAFIFVSVRLLQERPAFVGTLFLLFAGCSPQGDTASSARPPHNYAKALQLATFFYGAQRCGDNDSWLHAACHEQDGSADGVDLTGGWHDAGDYGKYGQNLSGATAILMHSYFRFGMAHADHYSPENSAPPSNGVPDIIDELSYVVKYYRRAIDTSGTAKAWYQVGLAEYDHSTFVEPVTQSSITVVVNGGQPRPVYSFTQSCSNYAGSAAATLAFYANAIGSGNADYAAIVSKAVDYYNLGKVSPAACAAQGGTYLADNFADDMALAAIALYHVTGTATYLTEAIAWHDNSNFAMPTPNALNSGYMDPIVSYELYKITGEEIYRQELSEEFSNYADQMTSCGYAHMQNWGSLSLASSSSYAALLYYEISGDANARKYAKSNIDFILGDHQKISSDAPAGFSFLIGYNVRGGGYPLRPHHAAAFGSTDLSGDEFTAEQSNPGSVLFAHELTGALVGGPKSACADYDDNIGDFVANEVAIDYNAGLVAALAAIIAAE